jgi:hypothetical protein
MRWTRRPERQSGDEAGEITARVPSYRSRFVDAKGAAMTPAFTRLVHWAPRGLSMAFALFLSVFALDAFEEGAGRREAVVVFLIHLGPSFLVVAVLVLAWRRPWVGVVAFPALGLLYVLSTWGRMHWSAYLGIAGPLFLLGLLFLASWRLRGSTTD